MQRVLDLHDDGQIQRTGFELMLGGGLHATMAPLYGACERVQVDTKRVFTEEVVTLAVTRTVTEEVRVYETRCPEVILADRNATLAADEDDAAPAPRRPPRPAPGAARSRSGRPPDRADWRPPPRRGP